MGSGSSAMRYEVGDESEKHAADSAIFLGVDPRGKPCYARKGSGLMQAMQYLAWHHVLEDETRTTLELPPASRAEIAEALFHAVGMEVQTLGAPALSPTELESALLASTEIWGAIRRAASDLGTQATTLARLASHARREIAMLASFADSGDDFAEFNAYELLEEIGSGSFGRVVKCRKRDAGDDAPTYACKIIAKNQASEQHMRHLQIEMATLSAVRNHSRIVQLLETFDTATHLYIITEIYTGGDLNDRVREMQNVANRVYTEREAAEVLLNALDAVDYLHTVQNILHRDIKAENFLLRTKFSDTDVVLTDFGLASLSQIGAHETVGTLMYMAPEVPSGVYNAMTDVWSLGVMTYFLLSANFPFHFATQAGVKRMAQRGRYPLNFERPEFTAEGLSESAKAFMETMIDGDWRCRPSAAEARMHPWFEEALGLKDPAALKEHLAALKEHTDKIDVERIVNKIHRFVRMNPVLQQVLYSFAAHEKERGGDAPGQSVSHGRSRRFASKADEGRAALAMAAELRSLRAFFAHADADDTGRVSVEQWNAAATLPTLSAEMQGALVSPGGTEIEYQRFVAASVSTRYVFYHQDLFKDAFLEFTGGREELTPDCVVERCGVDAAVAAEWVRVMDLSGSDSVTFAEFYAFASAQFNNAHTISAMVPEFLYAEPEAATAPAALAPPPPTAECFPCTVCGGVGSEHEAWCPNCSFSPKRGSSSLRKASSIRLSPNARLDRSPAPFDRAEDLRQREREAKLAELKRLLGDPALLEVLNDKGDASTKAAELLAVLQ